MTFNNLYSLDINNQNTQAMKILRKNLVFDSWGSSSSEEWSNCQFTHRGNGRTRTCQSAFLSKWRHCFIPGRQSCGKCKWRPLGATYSGQHVPILKALSSLTGSPQQFKSSLLRPDNCQNWSVIPLLLAAPLHANPGEAFRVHPVGAWSFFNERLVSP